MRLRLLILVLQLVGSSAAGQINSPPQNRTSNAPAGAERPPDVVVRELYREVVARHPLGIGADMKVFAPFLSKALLHRIDVNSACQNDWDRQNPDPNSKPPFLEFGLFTGDDLRAEPQVFHIEGMQARKDGTTRVYVKLTREGPGESPTTWQVAAIVVRENGQFVLDDVIYLKDSPQDADVRLLEYLSHGCDGSHWVGFDRR
jgi:hypothetical protein